MVKIHSFVVGVLSTNFYVIENENAFSVIDPGGKEAVEITTQFLEKGLKLKHVLITHAHPDHIGFAKSLLKLESKAKVFTHEKTPDILPTFLEWAELWNLPYVEITPKDIETLKDNDVIKIENIKIKIIYTPGHSPDSICFYLENEKILFSGDTLFKYSIGRADLPFGNIELLKRSIIERLYSLPDQVHVFPGHGNKTTIGFEKKNNFYVTR